MDSSIENEVLNDFKIASEKIDFSDYNPNSAEFLTALNLGMMWLILRKMNKCGEHLSEQHSASTRVGDIADEIAGAKRYLQKYSETDDSAYKGMAEDELKHANYMIKKAYSKLPSGEEKMKLKSYEDEIKVVSGMIQ